MVAASANLFPKVILEEVATDGSATTTPVADHRALFLGEDGGLHLKDSAAAVTDVGGGTPDAHAASHENGGSDEIDVTGLVGAGSGGELNYTEITSPVTISATTAAGADTVVTASGAVTTAIDILIEFFSPAVTVASNNGAQVLFTLFEDGTQIATLGQCKGNGSTTTAILPVCLKRRIAATSGTSTFAVKAYRVTANGTVGAGAGGADPAYAPAYIRITAA